MRFWYLTSACLPDDTLEGTHIFRVAISGDGEAENRRLLTANYEYDSISTVYISSSCFMLNICFYYSDRFQREFTQGVPPDWTITRIEHSKLL